MNKRNLLFLIFTFLLLMLVLNKESFAYSNESLDRAQRAIEHNQMMLLEQQRIDNERTQAIRQRYDRSMDDYYRRQQLWEQQRTNRNLERLNRGY